MLPDLRNELVWQEV